MRSKMLELENEKLQLEIQRLRIENEQLKAGGGGGGSGQQFGGPPQRGGGGRGPAPTPTSQGRQPYRITNVWKATWEDEKCSKYQPQYGMASDNRQVWFKTNQSFDIDFMTMGQDLVMHWDEDLVQSTTQWERPSKYAEFDNVGMDVLEDARTVVLGSNPRGGREGNLILTYNLDSGQFKELQKDNAAPCFTGLHCLTGSPAVLTANGQSVSLLDLNSGRPMANFKTSGRCQYMRRDSQRPNLFYVSSGDKIIAFDRNTKREVRSFIGLPGISEMQCPAEPGDQIIACERGQDPGSCKVWDVGTGKILYNLSVAYPRRSSLYGNVAAIITRNKLLVFDLLEGTDPVKEIPNDYQPQEDLCVTPRKIIVFCPYVWATTPWSS